MRANIIYIARMTKRARKPIPAATREQLWHKWFKDDGRVTCPVCNYREITPFDFEAGHKVPDCKGGSAAIGNLVPMCRACNRSMGSRDINEYLRANGLKLARPRASCAGYACCAIM
jgi:5-methylcytosine-specific restriction endonuclease McrA